MQLTRKEIDEEVKKALEFQLKLGKLILVTTTNKNAKIEEYIRIKNTENRSKGLFYVKILSWEDIIYLLEQHRETYN